MRDKPLFVGASPTMGSSLRLPATSRQASFRSGSWCNSSISPCEGDGPGANPGFLTNLISMGRKLQVILHAKGGRSP